VVAAERAQVAPLVGPGSRLDHHPPAQQSAVVELAHVGAVKLFASCHRRAKQPSVQARTESSVEIAPLPSGLVAMCSLDHGGGSFGDGQEALDARAHFTMELVDGGPLERVAVVRHELETVE